MPVIDFSVRTLGVPMPVTRLTILGNTGLEILAEAISELLGEGVGLIDRFFGLQHAFPRAVE